MPAAMLVPMRVLPVTRTSCRGVAIGVGGTEPPSKRWSRRLGRSSKDTCRASSGSPISYRRTGWTDTHLPSHAMWMGP